MDLARKVEIAKEAINSISRHDDEDAGVRTAILERVEQHIKDELSGIEDRIRSRIEQLKPS